MTDPPWRGWGDPRHPMHRAAGGTNPHPYEQDNQAAVKHGGRSRSTRLVADQLPDALEFLFSTPSLDGLPAAVRAARVMAAELWCRRGQALVWVEANGPMREDGTPQPVLKLIDSWERTLFRILEQHGSTPLAQATLAKAVAEVQVYAFDVEGLRAAGRQAAVDANRSMAIEPPRTEVVDE